MGPGLRSIECESMAIAFEEDLEANPIRTTSFRKGI